MPQYINVVFGKFLFEHICQYFWIWRIQVIERKINNKLKSLRFRILIPLTHIIRTKTTVWCKMRYYWSQRFVQFPCLLVWQCKAVQGDKVFYQFDFAPCSCQVWIQQKIPLSTWLFQHEINIWMIVSFHNTGIFCTRFLKWSLHVPKSDNKHRNCKRITSHH